MTAVNRDPGGFSLLRGTWGYVLLLGVALLAYVYSLPWRVSLAPEGIRDHSTCVLYIVNIIFFSGASAGALIVGALADVLETDHAKSIVRIAELSAVSSLVGTLIFIALDVAWLGHFWHLPHGGQFARSPIWDLVMIAFYWGNAVALLYFATGLKLTRSMATMPLGQRLYSLLTLGPDVAKYAGRRVPCDLVVVLVPASVLVYSSAAWLLGLLDSTSSWEIVSIAMLSYGSTVVFGLAVIIMAGILSSALLKLPVEGHRVLRLGDVLAGLVPLLGYCLWAEMQAIVLEREPVGGHLFREMTFGPYALLFWFTLIGGVLAPFLLLAVRGSAVAERIGFAVLLIILGVLVERWNVVVLPLFGHAHAFYSAGGYAPTPSEVLSTFVAYMIVLLVYRYLGGLRLRSTP